MPNCTEVLNIYINAHIWLVDKIYDSLELHIDIVLQKTNGHNWVTVAQYISFWVNALFSTYVNKQYGFRYTYIVNCIINHLL